MHSEAERGKHKVFVVMTLLAVHQIISPFIQTFEEINYNGQDSLDVIKKSLNVRLLFVV
jgi:hypothetical protein